MGWGGHLMYRKLAEQLCESQKLRVSVLLASASTALLLRVSFLIKSSPPKPVSFISFREPSVDHLLHYAWCSIPVITYCCPCEGLVSPSQTFDPWLGPLKFTGWLKILLSSLNVSHKQMLWGSEGGEGSIDYLNKKAFLSFANGQWWPQTSWCLRQ